MDGVRESSLEPKKFKRPTYANHGSHKVLKHSDIKVVRPFSTGGFGKKRSIAASDVKLNTLITEQKTAEAQVTPISSRPQSLRDPAYRYRTQTSTTRSYRDQASRSGQRSALSPQNISMDKVSPEMAAQIVKHFILPMFSSQKMAKKKLDTSAPGGSATIFEELKLSE